MTTDQSISRLRQQIGHAPNIALTPTGDVVSARNAFRAGVWDCLEDSVSDDVLADRTYQAWKRQGDLVTKDPCTQSHSLTVADYAEAFGKRMHLPARMLETLRAAALLHDIGKIGVPDSILTKPGPLSDEEFGVVKKHPETALEILGHVSFLADVKPMILHHHERFDGTGYPYGLAGDQIPIGARVLCVADAVDTMRSRRSYKKPYTRNQVRAELLACSGTQFDPVVASVAIKWLDEAPAAIPAM